MDVRVLEAGDEQPAGEVDDFGSGADQFAHLVVADGGDAVAGDGDGGGAAACGVHGEDRAAGEDEIGGGVVHGLFRFGEGRSAREDGRGTGGQAASATAGSVAARERPVLKYGDFLTHLAQAAAPTPVSSMTAGQNSMNQPLSGLISKWSAEV